MWAVTSDTFRVMSLLVLVLLWRSWGGSEVRKLRALCYTTHRYPYSPGSFHKRLEASIADLVLADAKGADLHLPRRPFSILGEETIVRPQQELASL